MKVACAVLAAGASSRMGVPKQLLPVAGKPLLEHVLAAVRFLPELAVVLGANAQAIGNAVPDVQQLYNPRWAEGLSTSLHTAVHWAQRVDAAGLLLCTCDQPLLSREHVERLVGEFERSQVSVASRYAGTLGVPALIAARHFAGLLAIEGDRGAGPLLRSGIEVLAVDWPEGAFDLDTPEDVARFRRPTR